MTQSQIMCFLSVCKHLNFSKAAEELFISQPAVSRQVSLMEAEIGLPLFDRTRRGIFLTDSGRLFREYFLEQINGYERTLKAARQANSTPKGEVRIGCVEGWDMSDFYPQVYEFFMAKYPNIKLNLSGYNFDAMMRALKHGEVDVIITLESLLKDMKGLNYRYLTDVQAILLYSTRHRLPEGRDRCTLADFRDEPFYATPQGAGQELQNETFLKSIGCDFIPKVEIIPTLSAIFMQLQSGRGALLSNDWMMAKNNPLFSYIPLPVQRNISVAWMLDKGNPSKHLFVNELLFFFSQQPKPEDAFS